MIVSVIGAGTCDRETYIIAERTGHLIAKRGAILITGGLGGVMEAASKGAQKAGGITVGILPGFSKDEANQYVTIPVITGMSHARNIIVVRSADAVIAVAGEHGTLSEIAIALKIGKPVIGIKTWDIVEGVVKVNNPEDAVRIAFELIREKTSTDT